MKRVKEWLVNWVFLAILIGAIVVVSILWFSWVNWSWLREEVDGMESNSATIRNVGLVIAGLIALPLAVWRGIIADRQAKAALHQSEAALRQSEVALGQSQTSQHSLLNERYQKGAEMLGNEVLSVRLGGIYALQRLAEEYPAEYHIQIMQLFCQFVRYPTEDESVEGELGQVRGVLRRREDVQAVMNAIGNRDEKRIKIEKENGFSLDMGNVKLQMYNMGWPNSYRLHFSVDDSSEEPFNRFDVLSQVPNFSGVSFFMADLSHASFSMANLSGATFERSNLSGAYLLFADLSGTRFEESDLSGTSFHRANLSGARFNRLNTPWDPVINLTQAQLDVAVADPDNPPELEGLVDPDTGEPLVWRGKAPSED